MCPVLRGMVLSSVTPSPRSIPTTTDALDFVFVEITPDPLIEVGVAAGTVVAVENLMDHPRTRTETPAPVVTFFTAIGRMTPGVIVIDTVPD